MDGFFTSVGACCIGILLAFSAMVFLVWKGGEWLVWYLLDYRPRKGFRPRLDPRQLDSPDLRPVPRNRASSHVQKPAEETREPDPGEDCPPKPTEN
jgi:hypothetical protein